MKRAAALLLVLAAACGGGGEAAVEPTSTTERPATTRPLTPDEAFLADLHEAVQFDNPEWSDQAISAVKQVCTTMSAGRDIADGDAPNDTPRTDAVVSDSVADMTLSIFYDSAGEDLQATAAVLVVGARHFCPEWSPVIEGDAVARGLDVPPN